MGWINKKAQPDTFDFKRLEAAVSHIEHTDTEDDKKYPHVPLEALNNQLQFIPREEIISKRRPGMLAKGDMSNNPDRRDWWIVIDNIVYDCTDFVLDHPGGEQVIMSFVGEDCSWQFWRFHSKDTMAQHGLPLRIGRTEGIENRFREPKRYAGLSRFGRDEW